MSNGRTERRLGARSAIGNGCALRSTRRRCERRSVSIAVMRLCPAVPAGSGSLGGGFVLVDDAGGHAPALADRDARLFRPCPDVAAALPA